LWSVYQTLTVRRGEDFRSRTRGPSLAHHLSDQGVAQRRSESGKVKTHASNVATMEWVKSRRCSWGESEESEGADKTKS